MLDTFGIFNDLFHGWIVGADDHFKPLTSSHDALTDSAKSDDAQDFRAIGTSGANIQSHKFLAAIALPMAINNVLVSLGNLPCCGHQQNPGQISCSVGQNARRVYSRGCPIGLLLRRRCY